MRDSGFSEGRKRRFRVFFRGLGKKSEAGTASEHHHIENAVDETRGLGLRNVPHTLPEGTRGDGTDVGTVNKGRPAFPAP